MLLKNKDKHTFIFIIPVLKVDLLILKIDHTYIYLYSINILI